MPLCRCSRIIRSTQQTALQYDPHPTRASSRILPEQGAADVTASRDRVIVKGNSETILAARGILVEAGLSPDATKEEYDIWAIYRALLTGSTGPSKGNSPET